MEAECERLDRARQDVKRDGFTRSARRSLFRAAHDIKGQAGTFGFPVVAGVAESLCRLIEHTPDMRRIPLRWSTSTSMPYAPWSANMPVPTCIDAATALTTWPREVTDEFLRSENSFRPDYLENIFAPPLVPGASPLAATEHLRFDTFRHQPIAEQARFLACGFGGEAAQEREQRLELAEVLVLAARQHALDHPPLQPRGSPGSLAKPPSRIASIASLNAG